MRGSLCTVSLCSSDPEILVERGKLRMVDEQNSPLDPDALLQSEFNYVAQTAFQANEDRARVTTFYLVNLGSFVAALYSSQLAQSVQNETAVLFASLFFVLSITGILTILQLIRLRQAWFESVAAMNQIKEYYRVHFPSLRLEQAFRWQKSNIPALYKPWSVSFLLVLQVAILSGISLAGAFYYFGLMFNYVLWLGAPLAGLGYIFVQMLLYWQLLKSPRTPKKK
jgi:hypothetical protein